jgi:hypothetical protein
MDTRWFAVDAAGHVAVFWTGENGHFPVTFGRRGTEHELLEHARHPGTPEHAEQLEPEEASQYTGVYLYTYGDYQPLAMESVVGPYTCDVAPKEPLHVDQLPPDLRAQCQEVYFDIRFDQASLVQPLEHMDCRFWNTNSFAYLCGDGKTVRPVRGHESEFAAFVHDFRGREPDAASGWIFGGLDE